MLDEAHSQELNGQACLNVDEHSREVTRRGIDHRRVVLLSARRSIAAFKFLDNSRNAPRKCGRFDISTASRFRSENDHAKNADDPTRG
jgi:hypothetical protein